MKKLLLFLTSLIATVASGALLDVKVPQQVLASPPTWTDRVVPFESVISTTLTSYRSGMGLGTEDSPTFTGLTLSGLTDTRVVLAGTAGLLGGDADLTFSGTRLTATDLTVTGFPTFTAGAATRVPFFTTAGLVTDAATLTFTSGTGTLAATTFLGALSGNATTATTLQTPRAIYGNNFDGSAALTQIIASTYGGTGNGFTKFTGPTTAEKTFTLPDASSTLLYSGGPLGTPASGTLTNTTGLPISTGVSGLGTGIATALAVNVGTAGAPVVNGGALGTPSSGTATNLTGTSGITGTGALNSGSITSGFGSIDVGADSITGGAISGTTGTFSSSITSTLATGAVFSNTVSAANAKYGTISNSAGAMEWGVFADGTSYIGSTTADDFKIYGHGGVQATFTSTGLNNTAIGATTPSTGAFTTLSTTGNATLTGTTGTGGHGYLTGPSVAGKYLTLQSGNTTGGVVFRDSAFNEVGAYNQSTDAWTFSKPVAVTGALSASGNLTMTGTNAQIIGGGTTGYTSHENSGSTSYMVVYGATHATQAHKILFGVNSTTRGVFDTTGLAVTGTGTFSGDVSLTGSAPVLLLQPSTTTNGTTTRYVNGGGTFFVGLDTSTGGGFGGGNYAATLWASGSVNMNFATGGTIRQTISSTGVAVTGLSTTSGSVYAGGADVDGQGRIGAKFSGATHNGLSLIETAGTSGATFSSFRKSDGTVIGSVTRVTTTDAVAYNTTSDGRLKTNVRDFTAEDSGRIIDGLRPRWFDWKASELEEMVEETFDTGKKDEAGEPVMGKRNKLRKVTDPKRVADHVSNNKSIIGFVAQEEAAVDPALVRSGAVTPGDDDPETIEKQWARSDAALVPILVAELKALRVRMAAAEAKIAALEARP